MTRRTATIAGAAGLIGVLTLLARAAGWVAPGGALVYATCSLEPAEGEAQVAAFLAAHPDWRIVVLTPLG